MRCYRPWDARKVTFPWPLGVAKFASSAVSPEDSLLPQLMETDGHVVDDAVEGLVVACGRPHCGIQVRVRIAVGFKKDDVGLGGDRVGPLHVQKYSSTAQGRRLLRSAFEGQKIVPPVWFSTVKGGPPETLNCCKPNWLLKAAASLTILGSL